jgi:hypothetical protein
MAVDDILTVKSQASDDIITTMGSEALYIPTNPLVSSFTLYVYISRSTNRLPDGVEGYVLTTQKTVKFRRQDLPTGFTPARGDRIMISGKPTYIIENKDNNPGPNGYRFNRYLPRYYIVEYHTTTTTTTTISTTSTTTTTTSPPP